MAGSRQALFSVVAIVAMLASTGGIAYMASVSYPDELGIVDARARELREGADAVTVQMKAAIDEELVVLARTPQSELHTQLHPVFVSEKGTLVWPSAEPLRMTSIAEVSGLLPSRGFHKRHEILRKAQGIERRCRAQQKEGCKPGDLLTAAAMYDEVVKSGDAGAEALLGLARIHRFAGEGDLAASRYRELADRFSDRASEVGVPFVLLADLGLAEVSESATLRLTLLRNVVGRQYDADNPVLEVVARSTKAGLAKLALSETERSELATLSDRIVLAQKETLFARRLSGPLRELENTANTETKSLVASWDPGLNLVYRRFPGGPGPGKVHGLALSEQDLQALAEQASNALGLQAGLLVRIRPINDEANDSNRLTRVSLAPLFPHLALMLFDEGRDQDAMAVIAKARNRHRAITGGLVAVLVMGLFATIRGAARERELARLKSDFVSTVSHELKTPLTSIRMFAEMLQQGVAGDDRQREERYHGIIVKESERLGLLIANLLDYSQIERGTRKYNDHEERVAWIAREAVETFVRLGASQKLEFDLRIDPDVTELLVNVDRDVVVQCVLNLLSNAAKYGKGKPITLEVCSVEDGCSVEIRVRDQGHGIAKSEQEKVFREFYRTPDAISSAIEGTGLGLALVKRHVEAQGGRVRLESEVEKGSTFIIILETIKCMRAVTECQGH